MTWEIFKKPFLDRFFPKENSDSKVDQLIYFRQGGMSELDYSFKITKLSKYAPSFDSDTRDKTSLFVT